MAFMPSGVPNQAWAKPIQQVPSPTADAANIKFSAAKEQFSTVHWSLSALITTST